MKDNKKLLDLMCAAIDMKEKMKMLYRDAAGKCSDDVGAGTFRMLEQMEDEHLIRLSKLQVELAGGGSAPDSCSFYDIDTTDKRKVMKSIISKGKTFSRACLDDIAAIESGMELENKSIDFFVNRLNLSSDRSEREFLNYIIAEERAHYIVLADLRFYYIDTEHWFMEKGRTDLDGAGAVT